MRTFLRSKVTLLFVTLGMLIAVPAVAFAADQLFSDVDTVNAGAQPVKHLGTVAPGATLTPTVNFTVVCSGAAGHFNSDDSVTLNYNGGGSFAPPGGTVSAQNAIVTGPSTWAADSTQCSPNGGPSFSTAQAQGSSQATITAPNTPGTYNYTVAYNLVRSGADASEIGGAVNPASFTLTVQQTDTTAPTTTASATVPNGTGTSPYTSGSWTNKDVTLSLSAQDNTGGSGVKEIRYTTDGTAPTNTTGTVYSAPFTVSSTTTVKYLAVDNAGNAEAVKSFQVNIDKIAPAGNCGSADGTWHAADVSIACAPTDSGGSGLASSTPASFNLVTSVAAGTENANASTDSRTISDAAGNTATAGPIGGNKVDRKAPEVLPADVTDTTWRKSSLSEDFTASDGGSGLANSGDSSFTLTASLESANATTPTVVSRDVTDAVGNTTKRSVSALIDLTKPNIDASTTKAPAPSGWYNNETGAPVVHFECSDALSGIAAGACPADHTITTEGTDQGYTDSVSDRAGNSNSAGVSGLKIDLTDPDAAGAPDLLALSDSGDTNDNLTNDKTPTFSVNAEAGSTVRLYGKEANAASQTLLGSGPATNGVATITSGQILSDGTYTIHAEVTDQAGNVSSTANLQVTIVTVDTAAPTFSGVPSDQTVEATGPGGANVTYAKPSANDSVDGSVAVNCTPASGTVFPLGTTTVDCSATDKAGNPASTSFNVTVVDTTGPVLTLPADKTEEATGPNGAVVTYNATANDSVTGSRPVSCTPASGTTFPLGTTTVNCSANDGSGNSTSGSFKVTVVDTIAPTNIQFVGSINDGDSFYFGNVPAQPTCTATDSGSGLNAAGCVVSGYSTAVGTHTLKATATDKAGNTATKEISYTVKPYTLNGFYQPIDMNDTVNTVKNGSTVPVKFELFSGTTELTSTSAVSSISARQVNCAAFNGDPTDEIEYLAPTGGTSLRYDATAGQFIYNWQTPKKPTTCYSLTMTAADGSPLTAYFKLR